MIPPTWSLLTKYTLCAVACVAIGSTSPVAGDTKQVSAKMRATLAAQFPGETISTSCNGAFLKRPKDAAAALYNSSKKTFRIVWVADTGSVRQLEVVPAFQPGAEFELQCLDAKQAKQRKDSLRKSEAIDDFLRLPAGRGALCYFVSETGTHCWSWDKPGKLIDIGGWQT